ncbi:hypothetical protein ACVWXO_008382 [Bradyrhizobium sp. LM2.7]
MNNCNPSGGAPPAVDNPCAMLPQLRAALYQLMAGQARAEVRHGDQWFRWQRSDVKALQHEVRRLEVICESGISAGRAVRVGPYVAHCYRYHR